MHSAFCRLPAGKCITSVAPYGVRGDQAFVAFDSGEVILMQLRDQTVTGGEGETRLRTAACGVLLKVPSE